jgi:predicted nucleic acid-binding protein
MDQRGAPLIVLDASITIAWLLNEPGAPAAELNASLSINRIMVPSHWPIEVGNSLLTAKRRNRVDGNRLTEISKELAGLNVMVEVSLSPEQIPSLIQFAEAQRLTLYDAAYVALATSQNAVLATLDNAMRQAAIRLGIDVLPA